jgi:hypothetical protein
MKYIYAALLMSLASPVVILAGAGPGPWANGASFPGQLDGKYMAVVTGRNISGVLGFAIADGQPPFRESDQQSSTDGTLVVNQSIGIDPVQNYFAIFVEGRTYTGLTIAGINLDNCTVAGALQGQNPVAIPAAGNGGTGTGSITFNASDALSVVNRGLSGGFTAKIKKNQSVFTFKGDGQLSTAANPQSYQISVQRTPTTGALVTNEIASGLVETQSSPFSLSGIRTSFFASNPQARLDQTGGGGAGGTQ